MTDRTQRGQKSKVKTLTQQRALSLTTEYHKLPFERANVVTTGEVCHDSIGNLWKNEPKRGISNEN